jgi:hypothetical protein
VLLPLPPRAKVEQDWTPSTITPGHLQKHVKQGFMLVAELTPYRVPEYPSFPAPVEGYLVSFVEFHERGISMPLHQFLHSLFWHYDLKLHHLNLLRVLYIAAFVTLCESYLGIDTELDLWNYFFCVQHPWDPEVELTISRGMVLHVKWGHGVDQYVQIPVPRSMEGWQKNGFIGGMTLLFHSPHLLVAASFSCLPRKMDWLGRTLASYSSYARTFSSCGRRG